jgi:hypothetical protein
LYGREYSQRAFQGWLRLFLLWKLFSVHEDVMLPRLKCAAPETLPASLRLPMNALAGNTRRARERGLGA